MAPTDSAKVSLLSFFAGLSFLIVPLVTSSNEWFGYYILYYWPPLFVIHAVVVNVIFHRIYTGPIYQNAVRGCGLGLLFTFGILVSRMPTSWHCFGWYLSALAFFHWSEYYCTAVTNPKSLTLDSYLLNHSREYHIAAVASWVEFWLEWALGVKYCGWFCLLGVALTVTGEFLRKLAMITASSNFNHYVQHIKRDDHELVTHGIYGYMRHPSYAGWFLWSVGTQIILMNPLCLAAYTYVSWLFFKSRIEDEEIALLNFFGEKYIRYQQEVGTGLPFIKGWLLPYNEDS